MIPRMVKNEARVSSHINIMSHYDDMTLQTRSGMLVQIIKLKGLDYISRDDKTLDDYKKRFNNLLKGFSSEFAIYCWEIRRKVNDYPEGDYPPGYAKELNDRYRQKILSTGLFVNDMYLAIVTKQPEGLIQRGFSFLQQFYRTIDQESQKKYLAKRHQELCEMTRKVISTMSDYGCELLSVYEKNKIKLSAPLELIAEFINVETKTVPLVTVDAASLLPRKRLFFNNQAGVVEFRAADGQSKFAAMLALKGYSPETYQGMLNELMHLKCEYLITQSYRFYDRQYAKVRMRDQQMEMQQSRDESISQTAQLDDAFDETASGEVGLGLHHYTLACYADSLDELNHHVGTIVSRFADKDMICVREETACECAFWAQFPGNFNYALRTASISTLNMAAFAGFHNFHRGQLTGNHWGNAVTVFETLAGTPYYFNFHYKDVGNFLVFGAMGSGKTLLIGLLIALSVKFGGKRVIFDKDRGLEIFVRMMGGVYERMKPGLPTGFNPCQLPDTPENRAFLTSLLKRMLSINNVSLSEAEMDLITTAIDGMYRMKPHDRQFCHMAVHFGLRKPGSIRNRFDQWHSDGPYAWLFDHAKDSLDLSADLVSFDMGNILNDPDCKTPAFMYLRYRVEQAMAGQPGMIFIDEAWKVISDEDACQFVEDKSRTTRKKNIIFGLATQVVNDTVGASISTSINASSFCKFFYCNPSADRTVYMESFGLSEHQYQLVKTLPDDQFYFLLLFGHGVNQEAVVARPDLRGLEEDIRIISGRESSLAVLDQVLAEVGNDRNIYIPILRERLRRLA